MRSAIRKSAESVLLETSEGLGEVFVRATRPHPWRPHNDATRTLFIHIPRTAGGSLSQALYNGHDTGHVPAWVFKAHDKTKFDEFFKFAIVRNPFDRLVSAYHRVLTNPSNPKTRAFGDRYIRRHETFSDFARALARPLYRWQVMGHPHFATQMQMLKIGGRNAMDYVGRFEELERSFSEIAQHFEAPADLGTENATPHKHYRDYYDDASRKIVEGIYKEDLSTFGYEY